VVGADEAPVAEARSNRDTVAEFHLPIERNGKFEGAVLIGLTNSGLTSSVALQLRALAAASATFALSLGIPFFFRRKPDAFLAQLGAAIHQVAGGQLELTLAEPVDGEFAGLARAFNRLIEGLQERDRMRHSLGRIMDPKIAEILIKENPRVGGLRRQATILFCDIRNYTTICEQLSAEELQAFLNEYWRDTVEIIMEQEGTIDKFHGDGVCVIFGAPMLHADDPLRAVKTAWKLVENVDNLNRRREAQRKTPIQIGIGIHLGEVIAGHIGSERRMDYTVVGDVVNVAARIEELNKKFGTRILISDNVYEKVEANVRVKTLTLAYLRGHKRPILVHALREFVDVQQVGAEQKKAA
jgi:adenylate cyclase